MGSKPTVFVNSMVRPSNMAWDETKPEKIQTKNSTNENLNDSETYDFVENTSCHGLKHIASSERLVMKVLWIVLFLASFGFLLFQVSKMSQEYSKYSAVSEVTIEVGILFWVYFCKTSS